MSRWKATPTPRRVNRVKVAPSGVIVRNAVSRSPATSAHPPGAVASASITHEVGPDQPGRRCMGWHGGERRLRTQRETLAMSVADRTVHHEYALDRLALSVTQVAEIRDEFDIGPVGRLVIIGRRLIEFGVKLSL